MSKPNPLVPRFLVLGGSEGWHSDQLIAAARQLDCDLQFATYESLAANLSRSGMPTLHSEAGSLGDFDAVLTRTMPPGSLDKITFRLAILHAVHARGLPIVNPPRGLEIAIDKFATLDQVARLGYDIPETRVVQSRREANQAWRELGGDCVVKPLFGGEGRGVMRIRDQELAWYTFSTLDKLNTVFYVQKFVPPGGCDTRLLVIGEQVIGLRRESTTDFRTNVSGGASCQQIELSEAQIACARDIVDSIGLRFASVDIIDSDDGCPRVLEVNAVPGWRGAQGVVNANIAKLILKTLLAETNDLAVKHEASRV